MEVVRYIEQLEEKTKNLAVRKETYFKKPRFFLTDLMARAVEDEEYVGVLIYGPQGSGKSTYAIKAVAQLLDKDFRRVVDEDLVFKFKDLVERVRNASALNKIPAIIWDDAGLAAGKYKFWLNKALVDAIHQLSQVIRTRVHCVLLTTQQPDAILKAVEPMITHVVKVSKLPKRRSIATCYEIRFTPHGKKYVKALFRDEFRRLSKNHPDYLYYLRIRDSYVSYALRVLERRKTEEEEVEGEEEDEVPIP